MKIPNSSNPYRVIINGVEKTYEAGATVPDDAAVQEIINTRESFPPAVSAPETPIKLPTIPPDELPPIPAEDGLYVLLCEVTDGQAVLLWENTEE